MMQNSTLLVDWLEILEYNAPLSNKPRLFIFYFIFLLPNPLMAWHLPALCHTQTKKEEAIGGYVFTIGRT